MAEYKFKLDKSSKKFICPSCGKKTFVKYRDIEGEYADDRFGRCDREVNCGYILAPKEGNEEYSSFNVPEKKIISPDFIDLSDVDKTLQGYSENSFSKWMYDNLGEEKTVQAIMRYRYGIDNTVTTDRDWVIFWQYDINGYVRSGKMVRYMNDGHRDKNHTATWYHACNRNKYKDFTLVQCFFGEHLLKDNPRKAVAIVESEKTAIIASCFMTNYIWISCGGLTQLGEDKCSVLKNRSVTLFPDTGSIGRDGDFYLNSENGEVWLKNKGEWFKTHRKIEKWEEGSDRLKYRTGKGDPKSSFKIWKDIAKKYSWSVSDVIEKKATHEERLKGYDIADYLIRK